MEDGCQGPAIRSRTAMLPAPSEEEEDMTGRTPSPAHDSSRERVSGSPVSVGASRPVHAATVR